MHWPNWFGRTFNRGRTDPGDPRRNSSAYSEAGGAFWPFGAIPFDLRLTTDEMLSTSTVWAAVRALVDPIASSEIRVVTRNASGGRVRLPDDAVDYLLNVRPGPDFTAQAFKEVVLTQTVVHGDGYAEIVRDRSGRLIELWPLQSDAMAVTRNDAGELVYLYRQPTGGEIVTLDSWDVLHFRGPSVFGLTGDSLVFRASKAIALHVAQEKFATAYFANGTVLGGFIKMPKALTEPARKKFSVDFKRLFGGGKRAHGIAFLEEGMEYQALGSDSDKSQLIPSRAFSVEEIARYFGIPLVRLGVQAAAQGYGTNVNQLNLQFVRDTLTPWVNRFCEEAAYKLFPQKAPWRSLEIDTTWLTQGDDKSRAEANEISIRSGVKTVNEARESEGLNGIGPEGDLHLVPNNLVLLEEDNLTKPEPAAPPAPAPSGDGGAGMDDGGDSGDGPMMNLLEAIALYGRRVRARRTNLLAAGKTAEEIAANVETTLRPAAAAAIALAIEESEGATNPADGPYTGTVTTTAVSE